MQTPTMNGTSKSSTLRDVASRVMSFTKAGGAAAALGQARSYLTSDQGKAMLNRGKQFAKDRPVTAALLGLGIGLMAYKLIRR